MKNQPPDCHPAGLHYHDLEPDQFRLLYVLPGKGDDILELEFNLTWLHKLEPPEPLYLPVSYRWNDNQPLVPVKVSGRVTEIPQDLNHLMRRLRHPDGDMCKTIWVDKLCINQDDESDKAAQIPLMKSIYQMALVVIVWLGSDGIDNCEAAFGLIDRWYQLGIDHGDDEGIMLENLSLDLILGPASYENLEAYASFRQLMSLDYWERTWVLQEATASQNTLVFYGDLPEMRLDKIFYARNLIMNLVARNAPSSYLLHETPSSKVGRVQNFGIQREGASASLVDLLHTARRTQCFDVRDKVYSMLSFANDVEDYMHDAFLKPDYTRSPENVYTDVARWCISKHQTLNFLGYCASEKMLDLPSWVPDWTMISYMTPLHRLQGPDQPTFAACGPLTSATTKSSSSRRIEVSGIRITTISEVHTPVTASFISLQVEMGWRTTFTPTDPYPLRTDSNETMQDAFDRTVVADISLKGYGDRGNKEYLRGGKAMWPTEETTDSEEIVSNARTIKNACYARRLFYAGGGQTSAIAKQGRIMGLGRDDVEIGDEVWALNGGTVLYVLRRHADKVSAPATTDGNGLAPTFSFVGEAYVHGLMDGEVLQYSAQQAPERPEVLRNMGNSFENIHIQ